MHIKLPYGVKNGQVVTIDEVESGLKCDCVCPACSRKLIARKGVENIHHFAHDNDSDCYGGLETVLHKLCKDILSKSKQFTVPALHFNHDRRFEIFPKVEISIDDIWLEKRFNSIIPDIIIQSKGRLLFVEITVQHSVTLQKAQLLKNESIAGIEIYAKSLVQYYYSRGDFRLTNKRFKKEILSGTNFKFWLHNPKLSKLEAILKSEYVQVKKVKSFEHDWGYYHYVDNCPKGVRAWKSGKRKGLFHACVSDCSKCSLCIYNYETNMPSEIYCLGHLKDNFIDILEKLKQRLIIISK